VTVYVGALDVATPHSRPCPVCEMIAVINSPTLRTWDPDTDMGEETTDYQCRGCWRILTVTVRYRTGVEVGA
jgi:hypothetical protein